MREDKMLENPNLLEEGLKLIEEASHILEGISDKPGVSPVQFYAALDSRGIYSEQERAILLQAASSIEMSLDSITESTHPTIH